MSPENHDMSTLLSAKEHWESMVDFCRHWLAVGGPDPHRTVVVYISKNYLEPVEIPWFVGCYMGPYVASTGQAIFERFPTPQSILEEGHERAAAWFKENWKGFQIRGERRPVRFPNKMAEYLILYAQWLYDSNGLRAFLEATEFESAWGAVERVKYNGRYAAIKLYEALRLANSLEGSVPEWEDIRPKGGWSPRITLAWLFPEEADTLSKDNTEEGIKLTNHRAAYIKERLRDEEGLDLDWLYLEILLCNYRQARVGRQYPGRMLDSELERYNKVKQHFTNLDDKVLKAREAVFPRFALGEFQGWAERKILNQTLPRFNYIWSDEIYDWTSTENIASPVEKRLVANHG